MLLLGVVTKASSQPQVFESDIISHLLPVEGDGLPPVFVFTSTREKNTKFTYQD